MLQLSVVLDATGALTSLLWAQGFGGALSLQKSSPAIIQAVQLGRLSFADAMGLAASAGRGGKAARQQRQSYFEQHDFVAFLHLCPNALLH